MALDDDDTNDMVIDDTPPNSPGNNHPPYPPLSSIPPPPSHPPPHTPSSPSDTGDQSNINDYEGFLDVRFMPQVVVPDVPLNVIYLDSYFEEEVPQEINRAIELDNDQINP
ncbi:unnamed protein product [Lactuca saligna]|uniref:Uncharacterized protein n=1 Tax=Lactuca saligna TaxID=75948 RepID=A0AA35ZTV5_LACSI|nr:unnamed protein product [Lactuca saligna]